jgi:hypothetical protein
MGRLFIFQNNIKLNEFIRDVGMPNDSSMVFEKRNSAEYKLHGGPNNAYNYSVYNDIVGTIYYSEDGVMSSEYIDFNFNNRPESLARLMEYSEICIVSVWDSVDDYFMSLYNYLFSLSESHNNCLPITVCEADSALFDNRVPLNSYMNDSTRVKRYRNKEYMNIVTLEYFKNIHGVSLSFDDFIMINVIDSVVKRFMNCPAYILNNNLVSSGLFTIDESFQASGKLYSAGHLNNYDYNNETCVQSMKSYVEYKRNLLKYGIDYKDIYDIFENASRYEHNQFKTHINQYFAKLANNPLQENQ